MKRGAHLLLWTTVFVLGSARLTPAAESGSKPPNIILILADDMGYSDLGCFGGDIDTPNLDRLASGGVLFTHMYNAARCSPTRASLLTGLYPHQVGMGLNAYTTINDPAYQGYLSEHCVTLAEVLREAGYETGMSGKWHIGGDRPHWPCDRGFDQFFGIIAGAANYWKPKQLIRGNDVVPAGENFYLTDAIGADAVRFVKEAKKPFFLYLAFTAPHFPLHARPEDIAKYEQRYAIGWDKLREQRYQQLLAKGLLPPGTPLSPRDPDSPAWDSLSPAKKADEAHRMAVYAAQLDRLDQNVGQVFDALRATGAEKNTLILFLSDNGASAETREKGAPGAVIGTATSFSTYQLPWANASNTPYRLFKTWVHEGGIITPMIAYWPQGIQKPGRVSSAVCDIVDIMPTFAAVAKTSYPQEYKGHSILPAEGTSFLPVLEDQPFAGDAILGWEHEGHKAVRMGQWKAETREADAPWELYNLEKDPVEMVNLASAQPDVLAKLTAAYAVWAKRAGVIPFEKIKPLLDAKKGD